MSLQTKIIEEKVFQIEGVIIVPCGFAARDILEQFEKWAESKGYKLGVSIIEIVDPETE
jgi:hypothetical protein